MGARTFALCGRLSAMARGAGGEPNQEGDGACDASDGDIRRAGQVWGRLSAQDGDAGAVEAGRFDTEAAESAEGVHIGAVVAEVDGAAQVVFVAETGDDHALIHRDWRPELHDEAPARDAQAVVASGAPGGG